MNGQRARAIRRLQGELILARVADDPPEKRLAIRARIREAKLGGPGWRARAAA